MSSSYVTTKEGISILGSTGSIGVSTLEVIRVNLDKYKIIALTANNQVDRFFNQCLEFKPEYAVMVDESAAEQLQLKINEADLDIKVLAGHDSLNRVASLPEIKYVMAAIVGAAGLQSSLAAAKAGKHILLANKESLVMSGELFMNEVRNHSAVLLPVDSEHNAIFQCLPQNYSSGLNRNGVNKIYLTGSGGPFRETPVAELKNITPDQACAHPNWSMGRKISVDSATMMNKGLEIIEAKWLFQASSDQIEVVIHPQSVIHSMVQYKDGSVLAQLGHPDMRTPIANALAWPNRIESGVTNLDLVSISRLDFEAPDEKRFPCLRLARESMEAGGTACTILNASNEIAVSEFLNLNIRFVDIPKIVENVLQSVKIQPADSIETIVECDIRARERAREIINQDVKKVS
ncbi:MAG: 1-deoxy-D-xylulose-5-phosphate reductoisomerase [Gammaproteobacteria bacterium]